MTTKTYTKNKKRPLRFHAANPDVAISVITSANNDSAECLSFEHLYALLSNESTGATTWADTEIRMEIGDVVLDTASHEVLVRGVGYKFAR